MTPGYRVLDAQMLSSLRDLRREFALDVLTGLSETPKRLSSKHLYDETGSRLFQRIMDCRAYYPTRCEREILTQDGPRMVEPLLDRPFNLVDLGAGDGRKTRILLEHLRAVGADVRYVPIDISEAAMRGLVATVRRDLPEIEVDGLVCDYAEGLLWLGSRAEERAHLVLFLGSNIGNFDRPRARAHLRRLWSALRPGDRVLVGFDLKKDIELLLEAYNDPEGLTAAFNLNLLARINRELGGDFDRRRFRHFATYNVFSGAMESYLVSLAEQRVRIEHLQQTFRFKPWEPIHTEYSYKYLDTDILALAEATGFAVEANFHDERGWFVDSLWRVEK